MLICKETSSFSTVDLVNERKTQYRNSESLHVLLGENFLIICLLYVRVYMTQLFHSQAYTQRTLCPISDAYTMDSS